MNNFIVSLWNSGMDLSEAIKEARNYNKVHGKDKTITKEKIEICFKEFEQKYGCSCIPLTDVYGFTPNYLKKEDDPEYLRWKGIIGEGKQLREMIAKENSKQKGK